MTFFGTLLDQFDNFVLGEGLPKLRHICLDARYFGRAWTAEERPEMIERGKEALAIVFQLLTRLKEAKRPLDIFELKGAREISESWTNRRLHRLLGEKLIHDGHVFSPSWKKECYQRRLATLARFREEGSLSNYPNPEPPSDDSDSQ